MRWTISNQLTMSRVIMIPLFIAVFFLPSPLGHWLSALVFALAAITDWFDGYLARTRGEITSFGRFLDPVADKLLVAAALVLLVSSEAAPSVLALIIISRELAIGALREWMAEHASIVHVSNIGKWKTAIQMGAIFFLLLNETIGGVSMHSVGILFLWGAAILTLWSGYEYVKGAYPELKKGTEVQPS